MTSSDTSAPQTSEASTSSFILDLPEFFPGGELKKNFRITSGGLFVHEGQYQPLISAYQHWLRRITQAQAEKSAEKCKRRLFGPEDPELFYCLDGKLCLPGYLMPGVVVDPKRLPVPVYQANLLATDDYLHPRDPRLGSIEKVKAISKPGQGLAFEISCRDKTFSTPYDVLREFASSARQNGHYLRQFPELGIALRECLAPLQKIIEQARFTPRSQRMLLPQRFADNSISSFLKCGSLVFPVKNDSDLSGCFDLGGRNFQRLINRELSLLSPENKGPSIQGFEIQGQSSRYLGKAYCKGKAILITGEIFREFIKQAPRSRVAKKRLPTKYTVIDCLRLLVDMLRGSSPLKEQELIKLLGRQFARDVEYRKSGEQMFVVAEKNILQDFWEVRGRNNKQREKQSRPADPRR